MKLALAHTHALQQDNWRLTKEWNLNAETAARDGILNTDIPKEQPRKTRQIPKIFSTVRMEQY